MKLHYMGKYDLNPDNLPHGEHMPNAVKFKEAESSKALSVIANIGALIITAALFAFAILRLKAFFIDGESLSKYIMQFSFGAAASMLVLFPHEILHAICFKEDVYLYTNWAQGLLFVVGPETMSKGRFIFMSLLPNLIFGFIPYIVGTIFPQFTFLLGLGACAVGMGFGDYYNVFNSLTQMPKGAKTYLYGFNSYWYMP